MYGSLKGIIGTLVDRSGTAFDQAELMISLLNEAALHNSAITNPQFEFGRIWLTEAQIKNWLNSDGLYNSSYQTLSNGGFAVSGFTSSMTCAPVGWAWVQVTINGTVYTFDPAAKLSNQNFSDLQNQPSLCSANGTNQPVAAGYVQKAGINLASAMGYIQSGLIGDAEFQLATRRRRCRGRLSRCAARQGRRRLGDLRRQPDQHDPDPVSGGLHRRHHRSLRSINPLPINTHQRWTKSPYKDGTPSSPSSTMPTNYRTAVLIFWMFLQRQQPRRAVLYVRHIRPSLHPHARLQQRRALGAGRRQRDRSIQHV